MATMTKTKVRITWNGQGGELDSKTITPKSNDDYAITRAVTQLIANGIMTPGDSIEITEIESPGAHSAD